MSDIKDDLDWAVGGIDPKKVAGALKLDYTNLPPSFIAEVARAINTGAVKYGRYNWRLSKVELLTYVSALKRHIDLFLEGQDVASDSNMMHLGHAGATIAVLIDAIYCGTLVDNRGPVNELALARLEKTMNNKGVTEDV